MLSDLLSNFILCIWLVLCFIFSMLTEMQKKSNNNQISFFVLLKNNGIKYLILYMYDFVCAYSHTYVRCVLHVCVHRIQLISCIVQIKERRSSSILHCLAISVYSNCIDAMEGGVQSSLLQ